MLALNVDTQGDRIILNGLQHIEKHMPRAARRGLQRIALGVHRGAFDNLSGPGAKASNVGSGGYPVPVRTGHLRGSLDWLKPGASKSSNGQTFTAGNMEAMVYDSAEYARVIHEGTGSSAKFGPRPYITDAAEAFFSSGRAVRILDEEISQEMKKGGL